MTTFNHSRKTGRIEVSISVNDATVTCPIKPGRDGWEPDSPKTETTIEGSWIDPSRIQVLDADGATWRLLLHVLIDAALDCDLPFNVAAE